jgi:hypothetical protein
MNIKQALGILALTAALGASAAAKSPQDEDKAKKQESDTVQTPFGPARKSTTPPPPKPTTKAKPLVEIDQKGDLYTFRRKTPFGEQRWTRLRSELSDVEKQLIKDVQGSDEKEASADAAAKKTTTAPKR